MDLTVRQKLLQPIMQLSQDMLVAAQEERWDDLTRLHQRRHPLLLDLQILRPLQDDSDAMRTWLTDILEIDVAVIDLSRSRLATLGTQMHSIHVDKNVREAYGAL